MVGRGCDDDDFGALERRASVKCRVQLERPTGEQCFNVSVKDRRMASVELRDSVRIDVECHDRVLSREQHRDREADIASAHHGDVHDW